MNEPFIVEDEPIDAPQDAGFHLTGWETVVFELEDEPARPAALVGKARRSMSA